MITSLSPVKLNFFKNRIWPFFAALKIFAKTAQHQRGPFFLKSIFKWGARKNPPKQEKEKKKKMPRKKKKARLFKNPQSPRGFFSLAFFSNNRPS